LRRLALVILAAIAALLVAVATAVAAYQFETTWGSAGSGQGQFGSTTGFLAVGPDGSVYIPDSSNSRVQKFTADGAFLLTWGTTGTAAGQFNNPQAVAVGPDGTVYVADSGNNRVQRFDANGTFLSQWGTLGTGDGQFNQPIGIAAGPDGSVYVADSGNGRLQRFLADGTFFSSFGSGAGGFASLRGVAAGPDGSVYAVDSGNTRVERFDASGTFQNAWGSNGTGDGQFQNPQGIAASAAGVYVADSAQNRVQKFSSTGTFLDALDGVGSGDPQFSSPSGIGISSTGSIYVFHQNPAPHTSRYAETGGTALPPPSTGQTANVEPAGGVVRVRVPGSNEFITLTDGQQIPIGSIIDVTKGRIDLTTTADATSTQTATFYAGVFKLAQTRTARPVTELQLFGGNFRRSCPRVGRRATSSARRKKKVVRQLWGVGSGRFRTKGRYSAAAIRGTQWLTQDRCDATVTRVVEGSVTVRDFAKRRNVVVRAGKTYVALPKAPRRRR
jgi:sugar lactone lactonase YvrE